MCGICGELKFDSGQPDLQAVSRMMDKLARRGPDHGGSFSDGVLAFGHRRLAVIDLSVRANQPMVDAELGLALVFNGTIYNYPELRKELQTKGYHFFSDGDTEVLLKAYHAWGAGCVEKLRGMFAFAIWDMHQRSLFLARDRFGIKPLYYSLDTKRLRFASNMQALLAAGDVDTSVDAIALHYQFTLHAVVPAPHTILNGVRKLAPATTLTFDRRGQVTEQRYWQLQAQRPAQERSEADWIEALRAKLKETVDRHRMIADVPVGVLLSGGLDSSLLVGLLADHDVTNLHTFSIGFEDVPEEKGSEFEYSDQVVAHFKTRHHKFTIPNRDVLARLPEAVAQMAEPMVSQDAVAFYLLAERVAREAKVVQSGQGADEVFGGYFWYPQMDAEVGSDLDKFRKHYFDRSHAEFFETVTPDYRSADHTAALIERLLAAPGAGTFIDRVLRMDATTLLVDDPVKRVDNMTMAFGLEARVPFLDHELVELAAQMPPELKLKSGGKHVLKVIARGLLPDGVIDRPKGYFPMPALKYVRGEFLDFMREVLNAPACRARGIFNRAYVDQLLAAPERYMTPLQGSKLWHLALLEFWLQVNVDGARL
ncbi:MAG: N-acetylglutaminylglutamine amidotransferase [Gammaproteobacteria bacterium]|nr:N-acetylglutaminylglutamine amidotransferase [Gammaproteobacteria bacterium]